MALDAGPDGQVTGVVETGDAGVRFQVGLVGGTDLLTRDQRTGTEPDDGYPVELTEWIERDGLNCLKVKLRGNDTDWDYQRLVQVGQIAVNQNTDWLTADFNCTVTDPAYVNDILEWIQEQ